MTEEKENCNFQQNYNVFGLDDKPCCYLYHKYCDEIDNCYFKRCKRLEQENKDLKDNNNHLQVIIDDGRAENKRFREENRELKAYKDVNEDFKKAWDELNKKYTEVLKLAKENADSNEYCLQELEKENEQLRSALEEIREMCNKHLDAKEICYATQVIDKIDEVLGNESK